MNNSQGDIRPFRAKHNDQSISKDQVSLLLKQQERALRKEFREALASLSNKTNGLHEILNNQES